jgi:restriction system protein
MSLPQWFEFLTPVLKTLEALGPLRRGPLDEAVALYVGLTADQMRETLTSGQPRYKNRIGWATSHLFLGGAVDRPSKGVYALSEVGGSLLASGQVVTEKMVKELPKYKAHQAVLKAQKAESESGLALAEDEADQSPQEAIDKAAARLRTALEADLLMRLQSIDPYAFERLVLKVLGAMGYGKGGSLAATAKSGDDGIDGIISQDPLGLDRIYLQAKRYNADNAVGAPAMDGFIGALSVKGGDRGVFITTSDFTTGARAHASQSPHSIKLINGARLVQLMVDYQVGVQEETTIPIYKVDADFFDEL